MTEIYRFSEPQLLLFFLVLVRISAFVVSWPVFGVAHVPVQLKILFAMTLAVVVYSTLTFTGAQQVAVEGNLIFMVIREVVIGLLIGYFTRLFFFSFQIGGNIMSMSMGLESAQIFDPSFGGQTTPFEQFYVIMASLFYLAVNGHHFLLMGLVDSFHIVPISTSWIHTGQFENYSLYMREILEMGIKLSAPVMISILVINLVLGIIGKTVPQLNVLVTSFPINILAGFLLLMITLPLMFDQMGDFLQMTTQHLFQVVSSL